MSGFYMRHGKVVPHLPQVRNLTKTCGKCQHFGSKNPGDYAACRKLGGRVNGPSPADLCIHWGKKDD